jgi:hypothetical protein
MAEPVPRQKRRSPPSLYPVEHTLTCLNQPAPTDYETVLSRLSSDITEAKQHLSEIRLRQRRASLLLNLYGVILWLIWCGLWYFGKLPWGLVGLYADDMLAQGVGMAIVVLGPVG